MTRPNSSDEKSALSNGPSPAGPALSLPESTSGMHAEQVDNHEAETHRRQSCNAWPVAQGRRAQKSRARRHRPPAPPRRPPLTLSILASMRSMQSRPGGSRRTLPLEAPAMSCEPDGRRHFEIARRRQRSHRPYHHNSVLTRACRYVKVLTIHVPTLCLSRWAGYILSKYANAYLSFTTTSTQGW